MSEFRIKQHPQGWVVEVKKITPGFWRLNESWTHYISVSGIASEPWYFPDKDIAMKRFLFEVECETIINSR